MLSPAGPASHAYFSQRLRLHYVDWGNEGAPPLLLIHGGQDHCRNWDWTAEALRHKYHIIAPDLRGHGDSQWITGGTYDFNDFVYDVAQLVHQKKLAPVSIVAHSLGGAVSLRYAGLFPEEVKKIIAIEGMGTWPQTAAEVAAIPIEKRLRKGIEYIRSFPGRHAKRYATLEEACERMRKESPHLSDEHVRHLTVHGMDQNEDGTYSWKFDNYLRARMGTHVEDADTLRIFSQITAPALLMMGKQSWARDPSKDGTIQHFRNARVGYMDAGHWMHHEKFDDFIRMVSDFLEE